VPASDVTSSWHILNFERPSHSGCSAIAIIWEHFRVTLEIFATMPPQLCPFALAIRRRRCVYHSYASDLNVLTCVRDILGEPANKCDPYLKNQMYACSVYIRPCSFPPAYKISAIAICKCVQFQRQSQCASSCSANPCRCRPRYLITDARVSSTLAVAKCAVKFASAPTNNSKFIRAVVCFRFGGWPWG